MDETARLHFATPPKIDQLSIKPVTRGPPAILINQAPRINPEGRVLPQQLVELADDCLHHRRQRNRVFDAALGIANPKLQSVEKRMEPNVPPDFLRVINAVGRD